MGFLESTPLSARVKYNLVSLYCTARNVHPNNLCTWSSIIARVLFGSQLLAVQYRNMKTAVTVLQEMMTRMGKTAEYAYISQSGPEHSATFEYQCRVDNILVTATARSKKEAKQEAARIMLHKLAASGEPVPKPYNISEQPQLLDNKQEKKSESGSHNNIVLLKKLCENYNLPAIEYELVGDTGPPHMRHFSIRVRLGKYERIATATTKKAARQLAAEELYTYLCNNLSRVTNNLVGEETKVQAHERAMERYAEIHGNETAILRPDLGLRVTDYHLSLKMHIEPDKCELASSILTLLESGDADGDTRGAEAEEETLQSAVKALDLTLEHSTLPGDKTLVYVVELKTTSPALTFAGLTRRAAVCTALRFMQVSLL